MPNEFSKFFIDFVTAGWEINSLSAALEDMIDGNWKKAGIPDRWDGRSAERILQILCC